MIKDKDSKSTIAPVVKSAQVSLPVEEAFKLFTEGVNTWWPLDGNHSVGEKSETETCSIEGWVGGRFIETLKDGTESLWGTVQTFNPPYLFATTWHPGNSSELATYLEIQFSTADGGTLVELTHSGWESRGEDAQKYREGYNSGWDIVFGKYIEKTEK
ncbi:MAG: hypothetical protein HON98_02930 [Chloroflexi bacterium]|jgi:uncharacterized protein YndB with AHSA1/START domain|nr:hypothetical protein [Chloroflexota bacterium]MBT3670310.1 hypothetical protein [Chloroflexota bacterium]MBT4002626.1 hypothetical protein [Chloroflexota bacterium]MBT4305498.1 hypothetical protein [Chloroflexota bacterium]MBT4533109.1 hypothetical protein [Chloroflexota bacterium]